MSKETIYRWGPTVALMGAIFFLSTTSRPPTLVPLKQGDKLLHLCAYATLAFSLCYSLRNRVSAWRNSCLTGIAVSLYGFSIEICQIYCSRCFEWADVMANASGSVVGCFLWHLFRRFLLNEK